MLIARRTAPPHEHALAAKAAEWDDLVILRIGGPSWPALVLFDLAAAPGHPRRGSWRFYLCSHSVCCSLHPPGQSTTDMTFRGHSVRAVFRCRRTTRSSWSWG